MHLKRKVSSMDSLALCVERGNGNKTPSPLMSTTEQKHMDAKIFENHLNPVILVFIR